MEIQKHSLSVCVCGAAQANTAILLHWLASGDVLGHTQHLQITLHDAADKAVDLEEQAVSLYEACYPLLTGVRAETGLLDSLNSCDVVLLLLEVGLNDRLSMLSHFAAALNSTPRTKQKAMIIAGQYAATAACILCALSQLSHHLVIAVDLPVTASRYSEFAGGYQLASRVSENVHPWWTELKEKDATVTNLGVRLNSLHSFVPLSAILTSHQLRQNNKPPVNWDVQTQGAEDFYMYLQHMGLTEAHLVTSLVTCKL